MFYAVNHPSHHIVQYLTMKILDKLEIPKIEIICIRLNDMHFKDYVHPIYSSVIKQLNPNFIK